MTRYKVKKVNRIFRTVPKDLKMTKDRIVEKLKNNSMIGFELKKGNDSLELLKEISVKSSSNWEVRILSENAMICFYDEHVELEFK